MIERVIPQNIEAEEAALGSALLSPEALIAIIQNLEAPDFYVPAHRVIFEGMRALWTRGENNIDPLVLSAELGDEGVEKIGGTAVLISIQANTPSTSNVHKYIKIIQAKATQRRLVEAGLYISDMGYEAEQLDGGLDGAISKARLQVANLELPIGETKPSPNIREFLEVETPQDWLVPGLVERGDRIVITAGEGKGKSTFLRQMAVQFAAGLHPWESRFIDPIKVLVIDVENSTPMIQRAIRPFALKVKKDLDPDNLRVEVRTEGLDLTSRHDARWLIEKVAAARPDLVTLGPIYKLHNENPNDEQPARKVAAVLDDLRNRYGVSLLIEAHSPHGTGSKRPLRPFGASMWMRWPEFGYGLRERKTNPNRVSMEEWRGARDKRNWPEVLIKGGDWPWTAAPTQQRAFE